MANIGILKNLSGLVEETESHVVVGLLLGFLDLGGGGSCSGSGRGSGRSGDL